MLDKIIEFSLLYDFYASLLTERQQEVVRLYHEENYSLSEIGQVFSISRQGVYDALKNAEKSLEEYEEKLGLVRRFEDTAKLSQALCEKMDDLIRRHSEDADLVEALREMKEMLDQLEG